jgi:hypothetical protein
VEFTTYRVTVLQGRTSIVPELWHQLHILEQLFLEEFGKSLATQNLLEHLHRNLASRTAFPRLGFESLEIREDLFRGVVVGGSIDASAQHLLTVQQDAFDEFAGVGFGVEEGDWGVGGDGKSEVVRSLHIVQALARDVGHVESGHEEGGGHTDLADVLFDFGFGVKMSDFGELSAGNCSMMLVEISSRGSGERRTFRNIQQTAPDQVLYANLL